MKKTPPTKNNRAIEAWFAAAGLSVTVVEELTELKTAA